MDYRNDVKIPIYRNDPELGRWYAVDPARQFASPYVFNANNPVNLYDADGRKTEGIIENEYIKPQSAP